MEPKLIHIEGPRFKDAHGRTLMLRGVNLGGSSKVPRRPDGATQRREDFFDHRHVSFVGRPFLLAEADEHFGCLAAWGLTFLRFLVTWEAVEHAGPGIYDEAYLDYVRAVVCRAGEHGISLLIDPHQDVWSRFSGGAGAPGWTLEAVGFDLPRLAETGAAIVHATLADPLPKMIWPTNGSKLAAATMFTLFFGGSDFAPLTQVAGEPIQEYLQQHYIAAIQQVVLRLKDLPNVIGYDTLNEPLAGYIGWRDLNAAGGLLLGACPTPFQAMLLGAGVPQRVGVWELGPASIRRAGTRLLNETGARAWREGCACVWRQNGVWDFDPAGQPRLLRPNHFGRVDGRSVDFGRDYYRPFANRFAAAIRAVDPRATIFLETTAGGPLPPWRVEDAAGVAYAPHWYDGMVLMTKRFSRFVAADARTHRPVFLPGPIRKSFAAQLADLKRSGEGAAGAPVPVLLGEFGIPFDLDEKKAYGSRDFSAQAWALDRSFRAVEDNLLNCTLWNYTADNTNAHGDGWNDEDLSIFSRDQQDDPRNRDSGGRALRAVVRPYPRVTAGEPLRLTFDMVSRVFEFEFHHDPQVGAPTEIFVPRFQYPQGCRAEVSDGSVEIDEAQQKLIYRHATEHPRHRLRISPAAG